MLEVNKCNPLEAQHLKDLTLVFPIGLTKSNIVYPKGMMKNTYQFAQVFWLKVRMHWKEGKKNQPEYFVVLKDWGWSILVSVFNSDFIARVVERTEEVNVFRGISSVSRIHLGRLGHWSGWTGIKIKKYSSISSH